MLKTLALTAAAMAALTVPAHAHGAHHTHIAKKAPAMTAAGVCDVAVSKANLQRVEAVFRSMPQSTRKNLQHVLRHADLYDGSDDGIWGPKTECAMAPVVARYNGMMDDAALVGFFEYMLDGGFVLDYPSVDGTPNPYPHRGMLY
ncbi:hypothetical protein ACGYLO_10835 [Sulfitobacter sp. 1A13353]|uniref:hypothetical protein n=1 Tax=Sulfitobacter sp. 1A13353 TaxID=3368568 RepID=UPI003745AF4F